MTKIFATGVTGYIGGDAVFAINQAHPEYQFTVLARNSDKGAAIAKEYPSFRIVYGNLDDVGLIEEESKKADIVLHFADADHEPAVKAIIQGLSGHEPFNPGFFIHTSGTGSLLINDIKSQTFGEASDKIYNDLEGVSEPTSLPLDAPHRITDKLILDAGAEQKDRLKTAIVAPPAIYGEGRGPDSKRSIQLPDLAKYTLERGKGFKVGSGKTLWSNIHVHDLSDLYLKLVENAAAGGSLAEWPGKPALWGAEGYFFCENGDHIWGEVSQWVATEAHKQGHIKSDEVESISAEQAGQLRPYGQALWGANSRSRAKRAREALKWEPTRSSLKDEVKAAVAIEAKKLGIPPGHAKVAAGDA